ncbi:UNKNOWN [Stylonychia lemnae]|uniref:Uncharacterized protein n=1 Tax=Stylonychia lemnae TaxID=5949 RepID=A0A078A1F4_STYLE|nr:UNKNOWN [Stylonychia lemnae]|eukprot:CDW74609.1 UNKNOWN [Stylonychia lemnae]
MHQFRSESPTKFLATSITSTLNPEIKHQSSQKIDLSLNPEDFKVIEEQFKELDSKIFHKAKEYKKLLKERVSYEPKEEDSKKEEDLQEAKSTSPFLFVPQSPRPDRIINTRLVSQICQNINGYDIKHSLLEMDVESHGTILPRAIKHIMCNPPVPIKMICAVTIIQESLGCVDEPIMSQFWRDSTTHKFDTLQYPLNLIKYEDEVLIDGATGEIHYVLRILYEGAYQRFKYTYERNLKQAEGDFKLQAFDYINQ